MLRQDVVADLVAVDEALAQWVHLRVDPDLARTEVDYALEAVPDVVDKVAKSVPKLALLVRRERDLACRDEFRYAHGLVNGRRDVTDSVGAFEQPQHILPNAFHLVGRQVTIEARQ